jgi:hypothetical protein
MTNRATVAPSSAASVWARMRPEGTRDHRLPIRRYRRW